MLWELQSTNDEQFFKSWNTTVKLVWGVPRSTFTYRVEGFYAGEQISLRNQILSRYRGFFRGLISSPSKEVRILARIVKDDPKSTTCRNLRYLRQKTSMEQVESVSNWRLKKALGIYHIIFENIFRSLELFQYFAITDPNPNKNCFPCLPHC